MNVFDREIFALDNMTQEQFEAYLETDDLEVDETDLEQGRSQRNTNAYKYKR